MSGNVQITGVPTTPGPDGSVPLRREIRELQKNSPDLFNLYLLGLRALQGVDEEELTSYYQIAGIHGMPFKAWDNVQSNTDWATTQGFGGYCTHSSILFTTWHRPYLALFEQSLYAAVQAVAQQFPPSLKDRYVQAAKDFRLPYFDWASKPLAGSSAFPAIISSPQIGVTDVDGKTKSIENPLYRFDFHPVNPAPGDFDDNWSQYPTTVRYPDSDGKSQDSQIAPILANENASLRSNVLLLLLSYHEFDAFSNNSFDVSTSNPGRYGSLEDVHNEIHDKTGGNGHMSALETSAFDPFFWLHHVNVDRLWAIWQDLNPDSFISPQPAPYTTFDFEAGDSQTAESALTPFWDGTGTDFWTSTRVKETATFAYAYPETQQWTYSSPSAYQKALRQIVSQLYGGNVFHNLAQSLVAQPSVAVAATDKGIKPLPPAASTVKKSLKDDPVVSVAAVEADSPPAHELSVPDADVAQKPVVSIKNSHDEHATTDDSKGPIPASLAHLAPNYRYSEWIVNVRALKHGLGQSFRVLVFLGPINPDPTTWSLESNCVGRVSVLGRRIDTPCAKCRRDQAGELLVSGTVSLTAALLQDVVAGRLRSLDAADVVPYLRANLAWKVTLFSGEERAAADVPGLKVGVSSTEVAIGSDGVPVFSGVYVQHVEVTEGVAGGIGPADA